MKYLRYLLILILYSCTPAFAADKTVGDAANKVTDFAIQKVNGLIDAASKALPTATKYAMEVTSLNCLMKFIPLMILIPLFIISSYITYRFWKWFPTQRDESACIPIGVFTLFPLGLGIAICAIISDGWNWVCVFRPDLYLIHLAVQKVLG